MKTLKLRDLGGPADSEVEISGETFEELTNNCKQHVMEQIAAGDQAYLAAVERMKSLSPEEQQAEFASYKAKFDAAPEV